MGIDITGFSHARRIIKRHSDEVCDRDEHYPVGNERSLRDGLKPGCYVHDGKSHGFCITYAGFDTWRDALASIVHGVQASEIWEHPRRYKGQAFVELIALPYDNNIGVGPTTSLKLYRDFVRHSAKVKRGFQSQAAEAANHRGKPAKHQAISRSRSTELAAQIAAAIGGRLVGGDEDPEASDWGWKWEVYRDFRRAFKLASGEGLVLISI